MTNKENPKLNSLVTVILTVVIAVAFTSLFLKGGGADKREIEKVVAEYIENNPEKVIEALRGNSERQKKADEERAKLYIDKNKDKLASAPHSPETGNPKGDVTIVEFLDYSCGYCKKAQAELTKLLEQDKNLRVVYKQFPILGPGSELAARASLAAYKMDKSKFQVFHQALFDIQGQRTIETILNTAKVIGYDSAKLKEVMNEASIAEIIKSDHDMAVSVGAKGTPAFIVGDQFIGGMITADQFKEKIATIRGKK